MRKERVPKYREEKIEFRGGRGSCIVASSVPNQPIERFGQSLESCLQPISLYFLSYGSRRSFELFQKWFKTVLDRSYCWLIILLDCFYFFSYLVYFNEPFYCFPITLLIIDSLQCSSDFDSSWKFGLLHFLRKFPVKM